MKRPNGSGNIVKLPGKRRKPYAIRITDSIISEDGKAKQKLRYVGYYESQTIALRELDKFNINPEEVTHTKKPSKKKETFEEIYQMFLHDLEKNPKKKSKTTMQGYEAAYKKFEPLYKMAFDQITVKDYEDIAKKYENMSDTTIKYMKLVISFMYKTAMRYGLVEKDLSKLLNFYATNENANPHKIFTDEEITLLWANKSDFEARLLLILIYTGMRVNELLLMETKDVHIGARYMVGGLKTEAGKNRKIPISEKIIPLLNTFLNNSNEFLITRDGQPIIYNSERQRFKRNDYFSSIGMDEHSFHDARHTCATLMEKAGISKDHRKLILGHASGDVTDRYTHVPIESLIEDINKI